MQYHELFECDPKAGILIWKVRPRHHFKNDRTWNSANTQCAGKIAGYANTKGYLRVGIFGRLHLAHRIIWEMHNGPIPDGLHIDHRDRNPRNNSLSNLRLATKSENARNGGAYSTNKSGLRGVYLDKVKGKWVAQIYLNKKVVGLGKFQTKGLAAVAYAKASIRYHGAFSAIQSNCI